MPTDVEELTRTVRQGLVLSRGDPTLQQYFSAALDMLQLRKEDSKKLNVIFWDISSFEHNQKQLAKFIRFQRPDVILLNKIRCSEYEIQAFARNHRYEAAVNISPNAGVAILFDSRKIAAYKQHAGSIVCEEDPSKNDIEWVWINFLFNRHYYRLACIYCDADAKKGDINSAIQGMCLERHRCYVVGNFNRKNFKCNDMRNVIENQPTYAKLRTHGGVVVSADYASRSGILCSPADSCHVNVQPPKEPFFVNYAPSNEKFHFILPFFIQSEQD
ncbi:unnamed protein product [Caenorhabditis auriculariae]|uniref:Uncharacterized protein n=1 Tax=Caenorhabditis auriculariae TaxID=2777116 RepID=A0A8S1HMX2_9PELO|nr:unnamed protein product [Caenorhabditis auriculariae]